MTGGQEKEIGTAESLRSMLSLASNGKYGVEEAEADDTASPSQSGSVPSPSKPDQAAAVGSTPHAKQQEQQVTPQGKKDKFDSEAEVIRKQRAWKTIADRVTTTATHQCSIAISMMRDCEAAGPDVLRECTREYSFLEK